MANPAQPVEPTDQPANHKLTPATYKAAITVLIEAFQDQRTQTRLSAVKNLCQIADPREDILLALRSTLHDQDIWVRNSVVKHLGDLRATKAVIPLLLKGLNDLAAKIRCETARTLGNIATSSVNSEQLTLSKLTA